MHLQENRHYPQIKMLSLFPLQQKILQKNNFNLIYDKKISSSTWFTDIKAHDLIFAKDIN